MEIEDLDVFSKVTQNLVDTLNGQVLTYNGADHVVVAEEERLNLEVGERSPLLSVCGPYIDTEQRSNRSAQCALVYSLELRDSRVDDRYRRNQDVQPITRVMRTVPAQIMKLVMKDPRRSENALLTKWKDTGYYFTGVGDLAECVFYVDIEVELFVNADNPYLQGA